VQLSGGKRADVRWKNGWTMHSARIEVAGILAEICLANRAEQKLSIRLEIDTRPPAGAATRTAIVNRHLIFAARN